MSCSMEIIRFYEECEKEELKKKIEKSNIKYPLYNHWTENEWLTFKKIIYPWDISFRWDYLIQHEPMMPFVYKLSFKDFMIQLEKDKKIMTIQEIYEKYTGEKYLV